MTATFTDRELGEIVRKTRFPRIAHHMIACLAPSDNDKELLKAIAKPNSDLSGLLTYDELISPCMDLKTATTFISEYHVEFQEVILTIKRESELGWNGLMLTELVWIIYRKVAQDILDVMKEDY